MSAVEHVPVGHEGARVQIQERTAWALPGRKAAMVSNLMVVLCGDQPTSPIVNAGTLYT